VPGPPLVTGATGFAGSHLVEQLLQQHAWVAAWAHRGGRETRQGGDGRVRWQAVDLLDRAAVAHALGEVQPSVIYHCAGIAHVGESWSQPVRALSVNVLGTHHVLEGAREAGLTCGILVTGSALVYRPSLNPLAETDPLGPSDPYGVSKLAQEMLASSSVHGSVFIVRPFNHAGPRQSSTYVTSSFARQIAEIEAGRREPVLHVGNLDARRDITDVRDTVRAYQHVVRHGQTRRPYNVCSGRAYRVRDLLDALIGLSTVRIEVQVDPSRLRPSDNPVIAGDRSRIEAETGWAPAIPIERTLDDLLNYWRRETSLQP
jgi:GDP-4-dehydro-6-deoxy-D-mannose reductase